MIPHGKKEMREGMKSKIKVNMSININDYWLQSNNNMLWVYNTCIIKMRDNNNSNSWMR